MELGRPPPVWQWTVVSGETQVLNSNSTSAVQDPPLYVATVKIQIQMHQYL